MGESIARRDGWPVRRPKNDKVDLGKHSWTEKWDKKCRESNDKSRIGENETSQRESCGKCKQIMGT